MGSPLPGYLGLGLGSLHTAFAWCLLGQEQSQQDGHVANALDMAMIFDYWGREPGDESKGSRR